MAKKIRHIAGTQAASDDLIARNMMRAAGMDDKAIDAMLRKTKADERAERAEKTALVDKIMGALFGGK